MGINRKDRLNGSLLTIGKTPSDLSPRIYDIILAEKETDGRAGEYLDNFVLVCYAEQQENLFSDWYQTNVTNLSWTNSLPRPPRTISMRTSTPEKAPGTDNRWSDPDDINSYLHHNAVYEMRTEMSGQYGNQATFDANGNLITNTIAAGTADFYGPYNSWGIAVGAWKHRKKDVLPFLRAIQLDGNPGKATNLTAPKNLNRPCLYQGEKINKYLECRPIIQPVVHP